MNRELHDKYIFREILPEEADQAAEIENICFPPNEACPPEMMAKRAGAVSELFLVAADRKTGKLAGFLNGIATDEKNFRDEFFTDASLHCPEGENVMLCGLDVLPEHRGRGLAGELVDLYAAKERGRGRKRLVLTCLENKVDMYRHFGFRDLGLSGSVWGGEVWHEMDLVLGKAAKLQIAADVLESAGIMKLADSIHDVIDIFEVGTPAVIREGMLPVRMLKERYPEMTVLADSKIMDGGALEAEDICRAGADILTVLAVCDDSTLQEVIETAHRFERKVMVDLMCVRDLTTRSREAVRFGADYVCVHTGTDMQKLGRTPLKDLTELVQAIEPCRAAVAGGISLKTLDPYKKLNPGIVIAGSSLVTAPDTRAAVLEMKAMLAAE